MLAYRYVRTITFATLVFARTGHNVERYGAISEPEAKPYVCRRDTRVAPVDKHSNLLLAP